MNNYNHVYLKMHEIIYLHPNHLAKLVPLSFISTKSNRARAYYIREVLCSVLGLGYSTLREKKDTKIITCHLRLLQGERLSLHNN